MDNTITKQLLILDDFRTDIQNSDPSPAIHGNLFGLGILWMTGELFHSKKEDESKGVYTYFGIAVYIAQYKLLG
ncbi:MAG: hypothetical protein ACYDG4_04415 [Desulfuromonadaceae bacterium]